MTGTVSPKGDIAMVLSQNGDWNTPWPVAKVMKKGGKLRYEGQGERLDPLWTAIVF